MTRFLKCLWLLLMLPLTATSAEHLQVNIGGIQGEFGYSETQIEIVMADSINAQVQELGVKTEIKLYPNQHKLHQAYKSGEINGIFSGPIVALKYADTYLKNAFLNLHLSSAPSQSALLVLVNKKSGIKSLKQLKGKIATFYGGNGLEQVYLETLLLKNNLGTLDKFFAKKAHVKNSQIALLDIFFGKTDVTLVPEHALETAGELNPQIKKNLMVLAKSEPMITRMVVFRDLPQYQTIFKQLVSKGNFDSLTNANANNLRYLTVEPTSYDALNTVNTLLEQHKKLLK